MATNQKLDEIADRLEALYQHANEVVLGPALARVSLPFLADLRAIKEDLEMTSGRAKRARKARKLERRAQRDFQNAPVK